ncbi:MAG: methyltransferase domain-containing protein [Nocardioidaceae bacterium]|nr:methyltransferase domain-containing protein [Nocardioidaceae bacterium]
MGVRDKLRAELARQLGRPEGIRGRFVARGLNRGNRGTVAAAVDATGAEPGQTAADIGFGGGVGLPLLLARVLPGGHVRAVDLSETMLDRAQRMYREETLAGSLTLHAGSITALPLSENSLDAAITVNTIYFVADLGSAFTELTRVLRPSGRVVVGLGDPVAMAKLPFTSYGFNLRPVDEVIASLTKAGLTCVGHHRVGAKDEAYHLLVATKAPS